MGIKVVCPKGHQLVADDKHAGRKIRCPHCQSVLAVPAAGGARAAGPRKSAKRPDGKEEDDKDRRRLRRVEEEDDDEDEGRARRLRQRRREEDEEPEEEEEEDEPKEKKFGKKKRLKRVAAGLQVVYYQIVLYTVSLVAIVMGVGTGIFLDPGTGGLVMMGGLFGLYFLSPLVGVVGSVMCCYAPPKANLMLPAILASVFFLMPVLLGVAAFLVTGALVVSGEVSSRASAQQQAEAAFLFMLWVIFGVSAVASSVGGFTCIMVLLERLAEYLKDVGRANEAKEMRSAFLTVNAIPYVFMGLRLVLTRFEEVLKYLVLVAWLGTIAFTVKAALDMLKLIAALRLRILKPSADED